MWQSTQYKKEIRMQVRHGSFFCVSVRWKIGEGLLPSALVFVEVPWPSSPSPPREVPTEFIRSFILGRSDCRMATGGTKVSFYPRTKLSTKTKHSWSPWGPGPLHKTGKMNTVSRAGIPGNRSWLIDFPERKETHTVEPRELGRTVATVVVSLLTLLRLGGGPTVHLMVPR